jgi:hypothetical protein
MSKFRLRLPSDSALQRTSLLTVPVIAARRRSLGVAREPAVPSATVGNATGEVSRGRSSRGASRGDGRLTRRRRAESKDAMNVWKNSRRAKLQQGGEYQRRLFRDDSEPPRNVRGSVDGVPPARGQESQLRTASDQTRALTDDLMERVCDRDNLNRACGNERNRFSTFSMPVACVSGKPGCWRCRERVGGGRNRALRPNMPLTLPGSSISGLST